MDNKHNVWRRGFLPVASPADPVGPVVLQWYQSDNYENYLAKGNKQYGPNDVSYRLNKWGYRCKEFDEIDHSAFKVLIAGCSNTFGVGLPQELTYGQRLCSRLESEYDLPVELINLGAGGRSTDYITRALWQSVPILCPNYVFCLFPDISRREYFLGENQLHYIANFYSPGWEEHAEAFLVLNNYEWDFYSFVKNLSFIELILRDCHWAWSSWNFEEFDTSYFDVSRFRPFIAHRYDDWARDNMHGGALYHGLIADDLMSDPNLHAAITRYRIKL
jgi:hypothetical protein